MEGGDCSGAGQGIRFFIDWLNSLKVYQVATGRPTEFMVNNNFFMFYAFNLLFLLIVDRYDSASLITLLFYIFLCKPLPDWQQIHVVRCRSHGFIFFHLSSVPQ